MSLRVRHYFIADPADPQDCYRCEFPRDEEEVHFDPEIERRRNNTLIRKQPTPFTPQWLAEHEWQRLRDSGLSEGELAELSGTG